MQFYYKKAGCDDFLMIKNLRKILYFFEFNVILNIYVREFLCYIIFLRTNLFYSRRFFL